MTLALHNTLTRKTEPFLPLQAPRVTLYTCGPTVWNYAHIGNFRTFLFEDLLRRWLERSGYDVFHMMNLTDVDDRTIRAARTAGKSLTAHTDPFTKAFFEDRDFLRIKPAHVYPRATAAVPAMIALVSRLLERGVAYKSEDGSVYFALSKFPGYGRLSQLDTRELKVGARVASDEYAKENPSDFALWKKSDDEDEAVGAAWDAPFGRGRPGWHLECSAMALDELQRRFGIQTLDIHCGGVDLIFPHHEDEIAQSEGATGEPFARYWMHGAFLNVQGTKMSKRFGNFLTVRDLKEQGVDPAAFRLLTFQTHYRKEIDYSDEALNSARDGTERLREFRERLRAERRGSGDPPEALATLVWRLETDVARALDDDLNAPQALAAVFDFVRAVNRELDRGAGAHPAVAAAFDRVQGVFDVLPEARAADPALAAWVAERIQARAEARKSKDFKAADRIREELKAKGVELEDTPQGPKWRLL